MQIPDGPLSDSFSPSEIDRAAVNDDTWATFVRGREADFIFSRFGQHKFRCALELGAGDCKQSIVLAKYCDSLVCTELDEKRFRPRKIPNVDYRICDAEDLSSFADSTFDLVFSSNMLEHVQHPERCLAESKRVLGPDGLVIATLPSRLWKIANTLLAPWRGKLPRIHGVSPDHLTEFIRFGRTHWEAVFRRAGFRILQTLRLPFYVGHGPHFLPLMKLGNRLRLSASTVFILGR
jgi:SAM-dependent methyltransferase